jgi:NACalpha-BTF3-like transcription factor
MNPITSATISGIGQTPLGPVEGTWVVGFFQDGADAQTPIVMGTLPGVPSSLPTKDGSKGFQDRLNANYPKYENEPDTNRLAVNNEENPHPTLTLRKADRDLAVGVANTDATTVVDDVVNADDGTFWNEPETTYAAEYPYNHVMETEGGHLREYDDTVGAKRIHERHSSGTGYEIADDGTKITRVKKDNYNIISADNYCHIQGTARQTIDGGLRVKVNNKGQTSNNYIIEVGAGANVNVEVQEGDINLISQQGDVNIKAGKNMNIDVAQALNIKVGGAITETSKSKTESAENTHQMNATLQDINGNEIELN